MFDSSRYGVLEATSLSDIKAAVDKLTRDLGFDRFSVLSVSRADGHTDVVVLDNCPDDYRDDYIDDGQGAVDPVLEHLRRSRTPIIWDQDTYTKVGRGPLWEHQAGYGYKQGIATSLHLPGGSYFILGLDRSTPMPSDARDVSLIVGVLQHVSIQAQAIAERVSSKARLPNAPRLSARELEVLRWSQNGKKIEWVADRMGIAARTATAHINSATAKLGCTTKGQALHRAFQLKLLD